MRKNIQVLRYNTDIIGYIWTGKKKKNVTAINSIVFNDGYDITNGLTYLISKLQCGQRYSYLCEKNDFNYDILQAVGFQKTDGTSEMIMDLEDAGPFVCDNQSVSFEPFVRGRHEKIRCTIQNQVFNDINRIPLTISDIFFDELQDYYYEKGAYFIKANGKYIGYGQIILENNLPVIVNFGIVENYRGLGYGKKLLYFLLNFLRFNKFKKVLIKVKTDNNIAIRLYSSCGFKKVKEYHTWFLEK